MTPVSDELWCGLRSGLFCFWVLSLSLSLLIERVAHGNLNLGFFFFMNRMNLINRVVQTIGLNQELLFGLILLLWLLFEFFFFFFWLFGLFIFGSNELGLLGSECSQFI